MTAQPDYYRVLNVSPGAESEAIRAAYLTLMKKYHPDSTRLDPTEANRRASEINAAYDVLGDPKNRARYDADRGRGAKQQDTKPPPPPRPPPQSARRQTSPAADPATIKPQRVRVGLAGDLKKVAIVIASLFVGGIVLAAIGNSTGEHSSDGSGASDVPLPQGNSHAGDRPSPDNGQAQVSPDGFRHDPSRRRHHRTPSPPSPTNYWHGGGQLPSPSPSTAHATVYPDRWTTLPDGRQATIHLGHWYFRERDGSLRVWANGRYYTYDPRLNSYYPTDSR